MVSSLTRSSPMLARFSRPEIAGGEPPSAKP
jgi:hypothetical protein